mgnify:CR=1 FL=1|jgi:nucleotide-binding universal stress UspA family protein
MFERILVAFDGSPGSRRALQAAIQLAREYGAELWTISVEEHLPRYAATVSELDEEREAANAYFANLLAEARHVAEEHGLALHSIVRAGHNAAQTIVTVAREIGADLLVLGHSGHSGVWGTFLGTTTDKVSHHAPCSVLIVR